MSERLVHCVMDGDCDGIAQELVGDPLLKIPSVAKLRRVVLLVVQAVVVVVVLLALLVMILIVVLIGGTLYCLVVAGRCASAASTKRSALTLKSLRNLPN